jgi:Zn-dependent protease
VTLNIDGASKPYLGVYLKAERIQQTPVGAVVQLGSMLVSTAELIVQLPMQAVSAFGELDPATPRNQNGAISIIGLGQFSGEIASSSDISFEDKVASQLSLLMSLNVALFVFNMIPLVPLDGGHIAGGIYEYLKRGLYRVLGKPDPGYADTALLAPVANLMFLVLLLAGLAMIFVDILNPLSLG